MIYLDYSGNNQAYPNQNGVEMTNTSNYSMSSHPPVHNNVAMQSPHCRPSHIASSHQHHQSYNPQHNYNYENGANQRMDNMQQPYHDNSSHYASYHGNTSQATATPQQHHSQAGYYQNAGYYGEQNHSAMSGHLHHGGHHQMCDGMSSSYNNHNYQRANMLPCDSTRDKVPTPRQLNPGNVSTPIIPRPPATQLPNNHNSRVHLSRLRHGSSSSLVSPPINNNKMRGNTSEAQVS